jgi:hypothetical protein
VAGICGILALDTFAIMDEFKIRSDAVDGDALRARIEERLRDKRGVDYTEAQVRELASVKLESFLDPRVVRSDLLQQFRQGRRTLPPTPHPDALFDAGRPLVRRLRRLLRPVLRLFFNPDPVHDALAWLHQTSTEMPGDLYYELLHNLVVELTRTSIEVKNLRMRVDSLTGRLDVSERRSRALESVVVYREGALSGGDVSGEGPGQRSVRRRRRRSRRGPDASSLMSAGGEPAQGSRGDGDSPAVPQKPPKS